MITIKDFFIALLISVGGLFGYGPTHKVPVDHSAISESAELVKVIDGDTIDVLVDGEKKRVRYIGIDTPELNYGSAPDECYAQAATNKNRELLSSGSLTLEADVSETDDYDRLLRYVFVDEQSLSHQLVADGYAKAVYIKPDVSRYAELKRLEDEARTARVGLWGECSD